jgi:hypothetical protein
MPTPERIPGMTVAAVVLIWVMLGVGVCGGVVLPVYGVLGEVMVNGGLEPGLLTEFLVIALVLIVGSLLRGVFAVKIKRRSNGARIGAIALESIGLALTVLSWFVTTPIDGSITRTVATDTGMETTTTTDPTGVLIGCPGIVPSILIIIFLSLPDSKRWCNR